MFVARVPLPPDRGNSNLRFVHIRFGQSSRVEHGLRRALRFRLRDFPRVPVRRFLRGDDNYIAIFAFLQKFRVKRFVYRLIADVECRAINRNSLPFQTSFP